jgi:arsenate reductase
MAEAFLNRLGCGQFIAESAGLEPGTLNANVAEVMKEAGIDISQHQTKSVYDLFKQGKQYDAVITVCDAASAEACPVFPGRSKRLGWAFADPSKFTGTKEEVLEQTRKVRDDIKATVSGFIAEAAEANYWI